MRYALQRRFKSRTSRLDEKTLARPVLIPSTRNDRLPADRTVSIPMDDDEYMFDLRAVEVAGEILWGPLIDEFGEDIRWRDVMDTDPYRWSRPSW